MLNEQIASASSKLVQFVHDLTKNIQRIVHHQDSGGPWQDLFQLRSDYARQLASLFDLLINQFFEQTSSPLILDPLQLWRSMQASIDTLSHVAPCSDLSCILTHLRNINGYFYNLLCHVQNSEALKHDQIRLFQRHLCDEMNGLAATLVTFPQAIPKPLPQSSCPINNNSSQQETSEIPMATNGSCYPCYDPRVSSIPIRCTRGGFPTINLSPPSPACSTKPMGCGFGSARADTPPPLCFTTPIVYTPEMQTLFGSGGILYVRKSGQTWVAENLGTLVETLKDLGEKIDHGDHCEILVRKTGDLIVRRKRGRRKHGLQETHDRARPQANNAYEESYLDPSRTDDPSDDAKTQDNEFISYENEL